MNRSFKPLIEMGAYEAHTHRFVESKKRRYDMGENGFLEYFCKHWPTFSRYRWIDHLEGVTEHDCFHRPLSFGKLHPQTHRHCPRALNFVKKLFLGQAADGLTWELLDFVQHQKEIQEAGFEYYRDIFPILCDLGLNDWRLSWQQYYRIENGQLVILVDVA